MRRAGLRPLPAARVKFFAMPSVRLALLALSAIALLVTLGAWALPDAYYSEDRVEIAAGPEAVFAELETLRSWADWHGLFAPGAPGLAQSYSGPERGAGARVSWTGAEGGGNATIQTARAPNYLAYGIIIEDGAWRAETQGEFQLQARGDKTEVRLSERGAVRGVPLLERYQTALTQTLMNRTLRYNLDALKRKVEARAAAQP